jgi:hypothetical protein
MGLVLGFVMPKINQAMDKLIIDQSKQMLNLLDDKIRSAAETPGSSRLFEFTLKKGFLLVNSSFDKIIFAITDLNSPYSEPGIDIQSGSIVLRTEKNQKNYEIYLTLDYRTKYYNLTYMGKEEDKKFNPASTPYRITINNKGVSNLSSLIQIDLNPSS